MKISINKSKDNARIRNSHLRARPVVFDGEYDMEGDATNVQAIIERLSNKARKMLNPFNKTNVKFNEEWKYYGNNEGEKAVSKDEFLRNGGRFEFIAWSDYAGGNRFEVSGEIFEDNTTWVFIGHGRFS
jgi:hypothetical protein